jgi:hypothetical protein
MVRQLGTEIGAKPLILLVNKGQFAIFTYTTPVLLFVFLWCQNIALAGTFTFRAPFYTLVLFSPLQPSSVLFDLMAPFRLQTNRCHATRASFGDSWSL